MRMKKVVKIVVLVDLGLIFDAVISGLVVIICSLALGLRTSHMDDCCLWVRCICVYFAWISVYFVRPA
ncbi:hypothetical protein VNO78_03831 [Psophocarpus tetragonolobus]|uniref:Uncharacterized protein n=1 Tax=Psophocarpus tetragonolobus TaxID=3891 RepID=A0AAN9T2W3_PSOTE